MNFKTFFSSICVILNLFIERKNLVDLARLNRRVTMMMPRDITLTLHSIEYVNVWFNLVVEKSCDYAKRYFKMNGYIM